MFYGFIHTVPQPGPFACQAQAMHVLILDESRTARAAVPSPTHITPTLKGAMTQPNLPVNIGRQSHAHERCPMKKLERHTQHRGCDPQSMCRVDRGACRRGAAHPTGLHLVTLLGIAAPTTRGMTGLGGCCYLKGLTHTQTWGTGPWLPVQ